MEKTTQQVQKASHDKTPCLSDTYILDPLPVKSIRLPITRPLRVVPIDWDALNEVLPQKDGEKPFAIRVHETIKKTREKLDSARKGVREDTLLQRNKPTDLHRPSTESSAPKGLLLRLLGRLFGSSSATSKRG